MPSLIAADARDPFHVPLPWRGAPIEGPIRVAFTRDDFGFGLHPDVATALDKAASALSNAGYAVEEVEPPLAYEAGKNGYRALMGEVEALMGEDIRTHGSDDLKAIFEDYYAEYPPFKGTEQLAMLAKRTHYAREWSLFLEDYPLVLTPFMFAPFFTAGRDTEGPEGVREVLGKGLWSFVMNFTGLPAGNIPTHIAELPQGPQPIGVQIAGRRWREDLIVDAMAAIEGEIAPVCTRLWGA
jgi:amidase